MISWWISLRKDSLKNWMSSSSQFISYLSYFQLKRTDSLSMEKHSILLLILNISFLNIISSTSFFKLNITSWNRLLQTTSETFFFIIKTRDKKTKYSSYSSQWTVKPMYCFLLSFLKWNRKYNIIKKPFFNMKKFLCWKYFIIIKIYFSFQKEKNRIFKSQFCQ